MCWPVYQSRARAAFGVVRVKSRDSQGEAWTAQSLSARSRECGAASRASLGELPT